MATLNFEIDAFATNIWCKGAILQLFSSLIVLVVLLRGQLISSPYDAISVKIVKQLVAVALRHYLLLLVLLKICDHACTFIVALLRLIQKTRSLNFGL